MTLPLNVEPQTLPFYTLTALYFSCSPILASAISLYISAPRSQTLLLHTLSASKLFVSTTSFWISWLYHFCAMTSLQDDFFSDFHPAAHLWQFWRLHPSLPPLQHLNFSNPRYTCAYFSATTSYSIQKYTHACFSTTTFLFFQYLYSSLPTLQH